MRAPTPGLTGAAALVVGDHDRGYRADRGQDARSCRRRGDGTTGPIAGRVGGGVLGHVIAPVGPAVLGTLLGAAGGARAGKAVDQNTARYR